MTTLPLEDVAAQRLTALAAANAKRRAVSEWRARLNATPTVLLEVLDEQPAALHRVPLIDLLRWARGGNRASRSLCIVNGRAVRAGVNLMLPLEDASKRTRDWVAEHGLWHAHPTRPGGSGC